MRLQDLYEQQSRLQNASCYSPLHSRSPSTTICDDSSLAISIAMSDQQYIDRTSLPDGYRDTLSQRCSPTAQPPTTTYPDLTSPPYSVTTFNQPQHSEPHLLTPVSGVGSPSIQQSAKIMQQHPSAAASLYPHSSPQSTSRMCWGNSFEMSAPHSQAPSPMAMNPAPTTESHFDMSYIPADVPIKDEIPEPPVPYFGAYGVSGQQESENGSLSPPMQPGFYMAPDAPVLNPNSLMTTPDLTLPHHSMGRPLAPSTQAPFHSQTQSNGYQLQPGRIADQDEMITRTSYPFSFPSTHISRPSAGRGRQRVKRESRMRSRPEDEPPKASEPRFTHTATPSPPAEQARAEKLIIKSNCPDEERFLFTRRLELETQKGSGIWGTIAEEFNARFGIQSDIPRLQMMVTRGRNNYLEWCPSDTEILREAMVYGEQQYWRTVFQRFKELGGGASAHWGLGDVEHRAVEMGWANMFYEPSPMEPSLNIRRRRKLSTRRRSAAASADAHTYEPLSLTPGQSEQMFEEILAERNIKPEDEEEEAMRQELQQVRLAQRHMEAKYMTVAPEMSVGGVDEGFGASPPSTTTQNRVTKKPSSKTSKSKGRTQRSKAA